MVTDMPLIYLASPYSSNDWPDDFKKAVENERFLNVQNVAAQLLAAGRLVFSPIAYSHQFATGFSGFGGCWQTWQEWDSALVARCDELWVLKLTGWDASVGVKAECALARSLGKPVAYITMDDLVPDYEVM